MPTNHVISLIKEVSNLKIGFATMKNDMDWVKKGIFICGGSSVAALLAVLGEIAIKVLLK